MRYYVLFFLLYFNCFFAQKYEYTEIWKRNPDKWEITGLSGDVEITEDSVQIGAKRLKIISSQQFIRQNEKIINCMDEDLNQIILRLFCEGDFCELYYYSQVNASRYFKFCLSYVH